MKADELIKSIGGHADKLLYNVGFECFTIQGDGRALHEEYRAAQNKFNGTYWFYPNFENAGKFRYHGNRLAVYCDDALVLIHSSELSSNWRSKLYDFGYRESCEAWVPGSGGGECCVVNGKYLF